MLGFEALGRQVGSFSRSQQARIIFRQPVSTDIGADVTVLKPARCRVRRREDARRSAFVEAQSQVEQMSALGRKRTDRCKRRTASGSLQVRHQLSISALHTGLDSQE